MPQIARHKCFNIREQIKRLEDEKFYIGDFEESYGYCMNKLYSYTFEGAEVLQTMQNIMEKFHEGLEIIGKLKVITTLDYSKGMDDLL